MAKNFPEPRPTDAELAILRVLWRRGPSTVREVHEEMNTGDRDAAYTTTLKMMQIMLDKGLLERQEEGRGHRYSPRLPRENVQRQLVGDLLDRAFSGSVQNLILHALEAHPASSEELAEIRRLLEQMGEAPPKPPGENPKE